MRLEYSGISKIIGSLVFIDNIRDVAFDETVEIETGEGETRVGKVLEAGKSFAVVQVFQGTTGLSNTKTRIRFLGKSLEVPVSTDMLGRILNSTGDPLDHHPRPFAEDMRDVNGRPINPSARDYPKDFIQTGISVIDGLCSLVRGQKLPIFSGAGLPHNELAAQIATQAEIAENQDFYIIFASMGIKHDEAIFFKQIFEQRGALDRVAMFLNLAEDPPMERIITPRTALTLAEYLAFEQDAHVLVILTDMTNYCEALRQVSASMEEIPGRKGYPGYLYSDLASIYERAGRIKGKKGSITQLPILSIPNNDIAHPIPDLTGYITEGQIVLDQDLANKGVYPPVNVLISLSRLMKDGIGKGRTREDHASVAGQLYPAYSRFKEVKSLISIIGKEALSKTDRDYFKFGTAFETKFVSQGKTENRSIQQTLDIAWDILSLLPEKELTAIPGSLIKKYIRTEKVES
ncbi:MAG: V-type ATP synthase subunit B [Candidatus Ranarchaeia archaeon]